MEAKKLYRNKKDAVICGVCSGIAEYLGIDVTILRVLWAFFGATGAGVLLYFICALLVPENPEA